MSILRDKRPSVHTLLGCRLPKPVRTFGVGLIDFPDGPYPDEPSELPASLWHSPDDDSYWAARELWEDGNAAVSEGRASTLPSVNGRGLTTAEFTAITRASNVALYRAGRFADDNADPFPFECSRVAASIALRVVLARRPPPIRGGLSRGGYTGAAQGRADPGVCARPL